MTYKISYRCRNPKEGVVPVFDLHYKKSGDVIWEKSKYDGLSIDTFVWNEMNAVYASVYEVKTGTKLIDIDPYQRVVNISQIIENEFGGMQQYVNAIIEHEVLLEIAGQEDMVEVDKITESLLSDGWVLASAEIGGSTETDSTNDTLEDT